MFIGIEGIARKVTGAHIGVDGVARRVKKAYIGVDGVARLAWEAEGGTDSPTGVRAYLYNGVKLPELPEWDRETYPYAHILRWHNYKDYDNIDDAPDTYIFYATKDPVNYGYSIGAMKYHIDHINGEYQYYRESYLKTDGVFANPPVWEINSNTNSEDGYTSGALLGILIWSNYQVTSEDGLDCPAPSDPVPLCSYNGVELPELPEETNSYVHKFIHDSHGSYTLYCSPNPIVIEQGDNNPRWYVQKTTTGVRYTIWNAGVSATPTAFTIYSGNGSRLEVDEQTLLWADWNVLYDDETTIYLEATEPQPVYM